MLDNFLKPWKFLKIYFFVFFLHSFIEINVFIIGRLNLDLFFRKTFFFVSTILFYGILNEVIFFIFVFGWVFFWIWLKKQILNWKTFLFMSFMVHFDHKDFTVFQNIKTFLWEVCSYGPSNKRLALIECK